MAETIKQGDAYALPVAITLDNSTIDIADIDTVEFQLGEGIRKLYPGDVTYDPADLYFYVPLTQDETFSLPADEAVQLDVRVKFTGGDVLGVRKMGVIRVADAISEVKL